MKFMDRSITPQDASGPSSRFIEGCVLYYSSSSFGLSRLMTIKDGSRPSAGIRDTSLYKANIELLGTSWSISLNISHQPATQDALTHNLLVSQILSSLNSPRLASRKLVIEILTFLAYCVPESLNLVTGALETVSVTNNVGSSPYAYWFASFEQSLSGRGKTGSLVLTMSLFLRVRWLPLCLNRIIHLCRSFNFELLNTQLDWTNYKKRSNLMRRKFQAHNTMFMTICYQLSS
jgi:cytokinesis protein